MPEIKRTFSASKMNKDVDERLVPPAEYRDALNVEINTSEDSDVGTVQTILGNTALTNIFPAGSTCVGSIADTKKDKIYWLVAGATNSVTSESFTLHIKKDYIVEWDVRTATYRYVLVDIYEVKTTCTEDGHSTPNHLHIIDGGNASVNITGVRIGMTINGTFNDAASAATRIVTDEDNITVTDIRKDTGTPSDWMIFTSETLFSEEDDSVTFKGERLLNFDSTRLITGINVLDGMLFWTDDYSEPKKINIERCILGTGGVEYLKGGGIAGYASAVTATPTSGVFNQIVNDIATADRTDHFHTRLVSSLDGFNLEVMTNSTGQKAIWLEEEHITVLRKAPLTPPYLEMSNTEVARTDAAGNSNNISSPLYNFSFADSSGDFFPADGVVHSGMVFEVPVDFRVGDLIILTNDDNVNTSSFTDHEVRIRIEAPIPPALPSTGTPNSPTNGYNFSVLSINEQIGTDAQDWSARLLQSRPFSEVAFLPGEFDYAPKQGYNLGMSNQLRSLKITDYVVEPANKGEDVVEVDILFKNETSPNIYTVKTLKPTDAYVDGSYTGHWPDLSLYPYDRGEYEIETELIHATVPSDQLIRPWDNVPIRAKAQEITANRLIYGNYVQNYDVVDGEDGEEITPNIKVSLESIMGDLANNIPNATPSPSKSVKSLRTYQVGVVYRDKYGRETPVLPGSAVDSVIEVNKKECVSFNKLKVELASEPPYWADSWKFFIKETSNEYYNLAMDRWYDAEDGNVWISFPSAERNKVKEGDFLELKKRHDSDTPVADDARYKIIAIDNEAPPFIKTNVKVLGKLMNDLPATSTSAAVTQITSMPFVDFTEFSVASQPFYEEFMATNDDISGSAMKKPDPSLREVMHNGFLFVRIGGTGIHSDWYKVANIVDESTNTTIRIDKKFENDILFASPTQVATDVTDGLFVEMCTKIPENKAEFDGRFFAKLYKDLILKDNIFDRGIEEVEDWVVIDVMQSYYINYSNVRDDDTAGSLFKAINNGYDSEYNLWPKGVSTTASTGDKDAAVQANYKNIPSFFTWNPLAFDTKEGVRAWYNTWGKGWFIDSAITANEVTEAGSGFPLGEMTGFGSGETVIRHIADGTHGIYDVGLSAPNSGTNSNGQTITDSWNTTGISGPGTGLVLSFTRIGPRGNGDGDNHKGGTALNPGGMASGRPDYGLGTSFHTGQANTVALLETVGTRFRFADDPDKHVYEIFQSYRLEGGTNFDTEDSGGAQYEKSANKRLTYKLAVKNVKTGNGIGVDGRNYNPIVADTNTSGTGFPEWTAITSQTPVRIDFVEPFDEEDEQFSSTNPGIWETEPKEDIGLDIYYEASPAYPISINAKTNEQFAKLESIVKNETTAWTNTNVKVQSWSDLTVTIHDAVVFAATGTYTGETVTAGDIISFTAPDGGVTRLKASVASTGIEITFENTPHDQVATLPFSNCFAFGNGVESNRIRDDYNAAYIANGVKASTVLAIHYEQERRAMGLIHSGIYNSTSGMNDLNQFIQGNPITKDLNPRHGSIQKLFNRNTDIVAITEDKCFQVLADKDALFNADGSSQLISSKKVLGQAKAYTGDFGTTNPESFAQDNFRAYFVDQTRGKVCRLSMDGITPISSAGMHDWFADNLQVSTKNDASSNLRKNGIENVFGSFDAKKSLYNVTIKQKIASVSEGPYVTPTYTSYTLSYSEAAKGWVSFKSFHPESGLSINNDYYTWDDGELYQHHNNETRNNFYGVQYDSSITTILNDEPGSIKSFNTLNYEGSQAKITQHKLTSNTTDANGDNVSQADGEYYNLNTKTGWYVDSFTTNEQTAAVPEFLEKEGKWFNYIRGEATTLANLDQHEFSHQGIGFASAVATDGIAADKSDFIIANNTSTSYVGADGTGSAWDATAD